MKTLKYFALLSTALLFACGDENNGTKIEASGNIESTNVVVSSKVSGEVIHLLRDEGNKVNAGDTIMIVDHESLEFQLRQATAGYEAALAQYELLKKGARQEDIKQVEEQLKQAQVSFDLAKDDKERMTNLYNSQTITKKQYDDAVARFDITKAQLTSAKENYTKIKNFARPEELKQAEANVNGKLASVDLLKKQIRDSYVVSPINGFIVEKYVEQGETVSMMSSLFKVSDLSKIDLIIYVSEEELGKVKLGQKADITTDSYPDKKYEGKVIYISPEAEFTPKNIQTKDERTKLVFAVKIRANNPDFQLKSGMPADAVIHL
ncbi:MAG: efflux RND transporter periplasmic adaptor subunit [Ignavibacteriaceae bacterium]